MPQAARLGLALLGLVCLIVGLFLAFWVLTGVGMSFGHGGNPVPDLREFLVTLVPVPLLGAGITGLICTTPKRLAIFCGFLIWFVVHITLLANL